MAKENRFKKLLAETSAEVKELNVAKMPDNVAPKKENKEMKIAIIIAYFGKKKGLGPGPIALV